MKPKPTSLDAAGDGLRVEVDADAERLEHVGGARQAGGRAVAVLGDRAARAGGDQRRGRRDVEGRPPAAGAGGVDQVVAAGRDRRRRGAASCVARPTSSSTVSPFVRSAISTAAVCTSDALPCMISASTAAAWSALQVAAGRERVDRLGEDVGFAKEVLQQALAVRRQHGLGMELHADAPAARGGASPSRRRRRARSRSARRAGRARPRASGSGRRSAGSAARRTGRRRRARSRSSCRARARGG